MAEEQNTLRSELAAAWRQWRTWLAVMAGFAAFGALNAWSNLRHPKVACTFGGAGVLYLLTVAWFAAALMRERWPRARRIRRPLAAFLIVLPIGSLYLMMRLADAFGCG